ncbi:hypothetical protein [Geomicrobium sp. JCM 19039]|uniref:hypothetical protein n=1 Tax=Geomicrobium sp. JCM 19039 TaxID=1460636 RepID=UPI001930C365|nr:hypothetical protein [Geomicrobium sp. JCM 19039]
MAIGEYVISRHCCYWFRLRHVCLISLGAGPRDGVTLAVASRTGWSVRRVRTKLEMLALLIGWLIGGPVAFGTFLSVFLIGPVMQASLEFWRSRVQVWENDAVARQHPHTFTA